MPLCFAEVFDLSRAKVPFLIINISFITYVCALTQQDNLEYEGIDISNWQRNINFQQVKSAGIQVVYIKASEGTTFVDPYFEQNYYNAKENGLMVGFYHFMTATTVNEAERQASFFASVIEGKEVDCKLAIDYEQFYEVSKNQINQIAVAFVKKLKQITRKDVIIYSNLNNIQNTFDYNTANEGKLWIAYYNNIQNLININSAWDTYIGIQYTSTGRVPGINGNVDRDKFSKEIFMENINPTNPESGSGDGNENKIINYIVKPGDTLSQIALKYGTTVNEIARLNGIQNVNLIFPGQVLEIIANSNSSLNNNESIATQKIIYTIKRGDTLHIRISPKNLSIQKIVNWNNLRNPNLIYAGSTLILYINNSYISSSGDVKSYITYTIKRGDTLWGIGRRFGVNYKRIAYINGIRNPRWIYPGQVLRIY